MLEKRMINFLETFFSKEKLDELNVTGFLSETSKFIGNNFLFSILSNKPLSNNTVEELERDISNLLKISVKISYKNNRKVFSIFHYGETVHTYKISSAFTRVSF